MSIQSELREESSVIELTPPDPQTLRKALASFTTGVTVATTVLDGEPYGMTANAFTSVSLVPPLTLLCVKRGSSFLRAIVRDGRYVINILSHTQGDTARHFASPARHGSPTSFDGYAWTSDGVPMLPGSLAWVSSSLYSLADGGDHVMCVGRVEGIDVRPHGRPLMFERGRLIGAGSQPPSHEEWDGLNWPWI